MTESVKPLREAAAKRSLDAYTRVINALEQMIRDNLTINVSTVAKVAGVSKNYIYKNDGLRKRVLEIRDGEVERITDASKDQIIVALQKKVEQLEKLLEDMRETDSYSKSWRRKYEIAQEEADELKVKLKDARNENSELRKQLQVAYDYSQV